jgi:hypothetical protein
MGRHIQELQVHGYRAVGCDLSYTLLRTGIREYGPMAVARAAMRHLPFCDDVFAVLVNFFTSFGYFATEEENLQVVREMGRVPLLDRQGEIDIAKRIESGQHQVLETVFSTTASLRKLRDLVKSLENQELRLDEFLQLEIRNATTPGSIRKEVLRLNRQAKSIESLRGEILVQVPRGSFIVIRLIDSCGLVHIRAQGSPELRWRIRRS